MDTTMRDLERIEEQYMAMIHRIPSCEESGLKDDFNGPICYTPDGNPLVGPVPGKPGYWSACAVMAGFLQGGGVGKTLAEWMIHGETEADALYMEARLAKRRLMLRDPDLKPAQRILFAKRHPYLASHNYSDVLDSQFRSGGGQLFAADGQACRCRQSGETLCRLFAAQIADALGLFTQRHR